MLTGILRIAERRETGQGDEAEQERGADAQHRLHVHRRPRHRGAP